MASKTPIELEIQAKTEQAEKAINRTREELGKFGKSGADAGKQAAGGLSEADKAAGRFYDSSGKLREANGQFVKGAQQAGEAAKELGKELSSTSVITEVLSGKLKAVAAGIAAYFGISAFGNVIKGAADFEEAMSKVEAATNTAGEELKELKTAAEQAGATTEYTAVEAANALENLAKAGLNGKEAIATLPAVMAMAQAGGVSLADAGERLTGVVMGMGLQFSESGRVADVLAKGANISRSSITGLAEAMSYAAPIAKVVGLSLESTTAIVAQFANAGIDASRAGTALNSILSQFSDPASKFKQELLGLGISTNNFDEALKQLAAAGPNGANAIRAVGLEAGPALQAALNLGIPALEELRKQLEGAEGSAKATADIMGANLNGALAGLSSAWDAVKTTLGTPVLPVLTAGVKELTAAFQAAIENGTIGKFGTALATAFQSAIEWVRQFAAFNWQQVTTDMQAFAVQAGDVFAKIGEYATNAGNIVKLAYGVMSAGTNAVLMGIYGIGEAFAGVARDIMLGVATIRDGLAKITFGQLSESFRLAAEDARSMAQGFGEASVAMEAKAVEAFNAMADGAQLARDGYSGLAGAAGGAKTAVEELSLAATKAKEAKEGLATALQQEWEGLFKVREEAQKKLEADKEQAKADTAALQAMADREAKTLSLALADNTAAQATKASADAVQRLQGEYKEAMASGDWMRAADIQAQITKEMTATPPATDKAAAAIKELKAQYKEAVASGDWQKAGELQAQIAKEMAATGPAAEKAAAGIKSVGGAATAMSAEVKDAIGRTGLDFQELSTGIGSAATSAITDVNTIIGGLDKLKEAGLDTSRILSASLSKAIDTADSQKALDLVKQKIEEVRKVLGDKIADGLLDQAKAKADELKGALEGALPGIQSVAEAMKQLGITTDAALKQSADGAKQAYDAVRTSGTASAREVGEAFKVAADKAIAANNGIAPAWVKAEASLRGYKIATDEAGKSTLELANAMGTAKSAAMDYSMSLEEIARKYSDAGAAALAAKGQFLAAAHAQKNADTANSSITKKQDTDKDGFKLGSNGQRQTQFMPYENYILEGAQSQGLSDQQANDLLKKFWQNGQATGYGDGGQDWFSAVNTAISKTATDNFKKRADAENALKQLVAYGRTITDREAQQFEDLGLTVPDSIRAKPPAPPAPTPAPRPAPPAPAAPTPTPRPQQAPTGGQGGSMAITPAAGISTRTVNLNLNGVGLGSINTDASGEAVINSFMDELERSARLSGA